MPLPGRAGETGPEHEDAAPAIQRQYIPNDT
jgi:hypothetical protein